MKIAAVSLIKDECDIIELFIRVNAEWADHFFVLDNGSTDYTPHILRRLGEEGYPITVESDPSIHYHQSRMTTRMVRKAMDAGAFDFVFPIDGDEFVDDPEGFKRELDGLPKGKLAALEWMTLVPNTGLAMTQDAPLFGGFSRRRTELRGVKKVVLPGPLARTATVSMGNHGATGADNAELPQQPICTRLAHVPVRSKEQIIAKTMIGSHKMSIKADRKKDEIFHWDMIAEFVRTNGFQLSDEQLRDIALGYGWSRGDPKVRDTLPASIGTPTHTLKYPELGQVNLPKVLDGFIGMLCEEIRVGRSHAQLSKRLIRKLAQSW